MIGIITFILFALIALYPALKKDNDWDTVRPWAVTIGTVLVGVFVAIFQPYAIEKIDPGYVGLRVNLIGDERGVSKFQFRTGWVVYNIYTEQVVEIPSSQQHIEYEGTSAIARGGFNVTIAPSFNYEIIPESAGDMYVSLRKPLELIQTTWLKTASIGATNDVVNKWSVDSIFNHRAEFEAEVMGEVNKRVGMWFRLSQIRTNITPPESLQKAIAEKTSAIQEAQAAQAKNQVIHMENLNKIMTARGDSASAVIAAAGEAAAMAQRKQEITPLYVEFLKVTAWDGKNPSTLVTNGSSTAVMVK